MKQTALRSRALEIDAQRDGVVVAMAESKWRIFIA
jgi:hypothetical protein